MDFNYNLPVEIFFLKFESDVNWDPNWSAFPVQL